MRAAWLGAILAAGGCVTYEPRPACPLPEVTDVAVLPVSGAPDGNEIRFGEILAAELVQFPGIEKIVRPRDAQLVLTQGGLDRNSVKDLRDLARELGVDAVLSCELHEYTMRDPPRAVVWYGFILSAEAASGPGDALAMVRQGTVSPQGTSADGGVIEIERVFDAEAEETADAIESFAARNEGEVTGLDPVERVRRIGSNFFRFASERGIRELFALLKGKAADDRKREYDRKLVYREG